MRREVLLALALVGCQAEPRCKLDEEECAIRERLGIPADAETVVILAQTAHLDIDWQQTFDGYYDSFVEDVFTDAIDLLETQPRAYYGVAEMAFVQHHLEVHPEAEAAWRAAAARGALRVVGGGMTSPDTLLSELELLARDDLYGIRFAEDTLGVTPRAAWLPDSFGQSATTPDLLAAAGWKSVAFSRVDGAPTQFEQMLHPDDLPPDGSTAARLLQEGSADFVWHGPGGGEVLAHFMAAPRLYCAGDNIDYEEVLQVPGGHLGDFRGNDPEFTDARIDQYVAEMAPYTRTPYVFVPVGCDFAFPKDDLIEYADGYNARRYPETGIWAVAAPFDDYADLLAAYRDDLPDVTGELSPYFMGFYGTRPGVKRGVRDAARPFFIAETFATLLGEQGRTLVQEAAPALSKLTRANHHDFVTGTANDEVTATEQIPLIEEAAAAGTEVLQKVAEAVAERIPAAEGAVGRVMLFNAASGSVDDVVDFWGPPNVHAVTDGKDVPIEPIWASPDGTVWRLGVVDLPAFGWRAVDLLPGDPSPELPAVDLDLLDANGLPATGEAVVRVVLSNAHVTARWDRTDGRFALTSAVIDGEEALSGPSFLVHDYDDDGGLWRLGHEMGGCGFTPMSPTSGPDEVQVLADAPLFARVGFRSPDGDVREAALAIGASELRLAWATAAQEHTTRTASFALATAADAPRRTSSPGGSVERPVDYLWTPTFWPAVHWASVGPWAMLLRQSTGVHFLEPGGIELIAARDARSEGCDVLGGTGSDPDVHWIEWRLARALTTTDAEIAAQTFGRSVAAVVVPTTTIASDLAPAGVLLTLDGEGIVSAYKPAERGDGLILRVVRQGPMWVCPIQPTASRWEMSDLAEREGISLGDAGSTVTFDGNLFDDIATVRLR